MFPFLSLTVSIKDYLEIIHQLIAVDAASNIKAYSDLGPALVYFVLSIKQLFISFFTFNWLESMWTLPVIVPDIASAMVSEISVLDGYFHTAFTFLDNPAVPSSNFVTLCFQKVFIGLANSLFLCLPTSVAHIITLRRFLIQGLEAGYISGLGAVSGNLFFLASVIFGWRFFLIPWLSLDIFRYLFGFILLIKYIWDSSNERRMVLEDLSKQKIFLLTFLLSLTEQTSIFPFISNISFGSDATLVESFSTGNFTEFVIVHTCYLVGILFGSLSLLHLTCWFWENPAFQIYMWAITNFKAKTGSFYKYLNFGLLYLTMLAAITSIPYFGLDYTLTSPLGLVFEDRILEEKMLTEFSFLNTGPTDRNTRRNRGRHPRRSRWNRRTRKYRSFQTNLYEKENYDWMTIEDLNFGFDRQWIHRKMRNHRARYRLFPGKLTRSLKNQARKSFTKRHAFFDTTENYFYTPAFHEFKKDKVRSGDLSSNSSMTQQLVLPSIAPYIEQKDGTDTSVLTKFARKLSTKIAASETTLTSGNLTNQRALKSEFDRQNKSISLLRWKQILADLDNTSKTAKLRNFYQKMVLEKQDNSLKIQETMPLSKKDRLINRYRTFLYTPQNTNATTSDRSSIFWKTGTLLHPLKYYLQNEQGYKRKLAYYGVKNFRRFAPDYNPPIFRVIMQRYFYSYKPTKRWFRTIKGATGRRYLRKSTRKAKVLPETSGLLSMTGTIENNTSLYSGTEAVTERPGPQSGQERPFQERPFQERPANLATMQSPQTMNLIRRANHFYSIKGKRAARYRYQIYRDVLQHWYYSPINRILPKIDIDSFIRRQPTSHFINLNEERLLHLRRFLVSDYFDTLRWYSSMKQYQQMKERIGGTKSLSSRPYNQQFFGTFKKIRHLFAVTPSLTSQSILSFDQPLYNEYENTTIRPIIDTSITHEELLVDEFYTNSSQAKDLLQQSSETLKGYLTMAQPIRQTLIKEYLQKKNYWALTQFLINGEKLRGVKPITNDHSLILQEKIQLGLTGSVGSQALTTQLPNANELSLNSTNNATLINSQSFARSYQQSALVTLLRKWKRSLGNQGLYKKALKNQFKNWRRQKKRWRKKLEKYRDRKINPNANLTRVTTIKTGVQKAIKDANSISSLLNISESSTRPLRGQGPVENSFSKPNRTLDSSIQAQLTGAAPQQSFARTSKLDIGSLQKETTTQLEINLQDIASNIRSLAKQKPSSNYSSLVAISNLRNKVGDKLKQTKFAIRQLYQTTKTKSWWTKKSTENWRPTRRRLDIDSLRKRIKRKPELFISTFDSNKAEQALRLSLADSDYATNTEKTQNERFAAQASKGSRKETWENLIPDDALTLNIFRQKQIENHSNILRTSDPSVSVLSSPVGNFSNPRKTFTSEINQEQPTLRAFLNRQFKRKRVSRRRGRKLGPAGYSRRPNLATFVKRQSNFNQLQGVSLGTVMRKNVDLTNTNTFTIFSQKLRSFRKRKHRDWEKKVKPTNGIKTGKYRKRRLSFYGKVRSVQKQLIRVRWKLRLQKWWWQFLPTLKGAIDAKWQMEADKELVSVLENLTEKQILARDTLGSTSISSQILGQNRLQIGDRDFKPLQMPEAIRLRNQLVDSEKQTQGIAKTSMGPFLGSETSQQGLTSSPGAQNTADGPSNRDLTPVLTSASRVDGSSNGTVIEKLTEKALISTTTNSALNGPKMQITNAVPFYAGWDESLRKLVITNVLFSLRDATVEMKNTASYSSLQPLGLTNVEFTHAPLRAQNGATTVYWQTPFTTYETDQFFTLGVDGFSPLQWRRFNFTQSIVKSWTNLRQTEKNISPLLVTTITKNKERSTKMNSAFDQLLLQNKPTFVKYQKSAVLRRRQKRYMRIRRHPRAPVWYPSGALISDVLPTQYVYTFDYTGRRPRERYIQRHWRKRTFSTNEHMASNSGIAVQVNQTTDFTLRRRPNGRRKYHRRGGKLRSLVTVAYPQRRKFVGFETGIPRWRPERLKKETGYTTKLDEVRKRRGLTLRRRKLRQIFPKLIRYRPFNGGFVWPGDYLMLDQNKVPKLRLNLVEPTKDQSSLETSKSKKQKSKKLRRKIKRKTRTIAQWNIQPKKYLLQKHNIKVLKKKLQKAYRTNQLQQKLQELTFQVETGK